MEDEEGNTSCNYIEFKKVYDMEEEEDNDGLKGGLFFIGNRYFGSNGLFFIKNIFWVERTFEYVTYEQICKIEFFVFFAVQGGNI